MFDFKIISCELIGKEKASVSAHAGERKLSTVGTVGTVGRCPKSDRRTVTDRLGRLSTVSTVSMVGRLYPRSCSMLSVSFLGAKLQARAVRRAQRADTKSSKGGFSIT